MDIHASQSPALRARLRRSLIQLGSLLAIALVVVGVFAMFSVWSLNRAHVAGNDEASRFLHALADDHKALDRSYRAAPEQHRTGPWNPFAIDRRVRGIDRPLNEALDKVAEALLAETGHRHAEAAVREDRRYHTLRDFLGWSVAVAIAMVGQVLWTAPRRRPDPA